MQVVGATAIGVARRPGAAVVTLAGDVAVLVLTRAWKLVRGGAGALRRRGSAWSAPAARQLLAAGVPAGVVGPRFVAHTPSTGHARHGSGAPVQRELALPADPTAPRRARAVLQAAAREWNVDDDLYQDAAMVVTELVANAVDHARTPSTLTVGLDGRGGLCVAVRDACPSPVPRPHPVDPTAPRGRGLQMIAALAGSWGVTTHIDGKTVWAVLRRP
jgi:anti-sigma regulatory factor (Ser/Thr protein kinase)